MITHNLTEIIEPDFIQSRTSYNPNFIFEHYKYFSVQYAVTRSIAMHDSPGIVHDFRLALVPSMNFPYYVLNNPPETIGTIITLFLVIYMLLPYMSIIIL
jgi:hypothetical protein